MFIPLNACPMKYEVNFIGAKPVYLGRSLFHRGFQRKTSAANLTGEPAPKVPCPAPEVIYIFMDIPLFLPKDD
jgi:hypothetical protein